MDAKNHRCSYGNGAAFLYFKVLAYRQTYGQSRHNPNLSDRWVTKFSEVWGSARAPSGSGKYNGIYHVKIVYHTMNSFWCQFVNKNFNLLATINNTVK